MGNFAPSPIRLIYQELLMTHVPKTIKATSEQLKLHIKSGAQLP